MIISILFLLSTVIAIASLMVMPKKKGRLNGVTWFVVSLVTLWCFWVFFEGIFNLVKIKVGLGSIICINIFAIAVSAFYVIKKRRVQEYFVKTKDVAIIVLLALASLFIGTLRYGIRFDIFAYNADDSVRHFYFTKLMIESGTIVRGKYVMYLLDLVFIKFLDPFIGAANWHRAFMLADVYLLFIQGAMFWVLIRKYVNGKYSLLMCYLFTVFYFIGYPVMNMLYGFEYLGAGLLMITYVLWLLQRLEYQELLFRVWMPLLMLVNTSIFLSYTQFAPVVLAGEVIYLIVYFVSRHSLISKKSVLVFLFGFTVPGLMCVRYIAETYWNRFIGSIGIVILAVLVICVVGTILLKIQGGKNISVGKMLEYDVKYILSNTKIRVGLLVIGTIAIVLIGYRLVFVNLVDRFVMDQGMILDGINYRSTYSNFLILLLPVVLYIMRCFKEKRNEPALYMMIGTLVFSWWMINKIIDGNMGSYYLYKMPFLMWLLVFYCAIKEVTLLKGESRRIMNVYLSSILGIFLIFLSGWEDRMMEQGDWLWLENVSASVFGAYSENVNSLKSGANVNADMQAIYYKVYEISKRENCFIPYFGEEKKHMKEYYYYLTDQNPQDHLGYLNSKDYPSFGIRDDLDELGIKYIFVQKYYEGTYYEYEHDYNIMWTEYENDYGWILKLD